MDKLVLKNVKSDKDFIKLNTNDLAKFKEILRTLSKYYNAFSEGKPTGVAKFRDDFGNCLGGNVYLKKFGEYEYLVFACMGKDSNSWVHIDGISEERKNAPINHPVHSMVCLGDLYSNSLPQKKESRSVA